MLILTPFATFPEDGEVIRCDEGHPFARVLSHGGWKILPEGEQPWPILERVDGGMDVEGLELPITCQKCGATAIDWDRRFVGRQAHDLTPEKVQAVLSGGNAV